ncbi:DUF3784 domain-containing protein [Flavobacterium dauae]|uniref:DUF3784 domain-containing protein n=1 Tax=Flavobacterium dauae TaxID=1563479 RepID=UPI00101B2319|nr:DUF3784 domain-containing protein [Flavobacterium dauae]WLD24791.1 DUF3784 domain-containing protein [Flavobacterium dauae]
MASILNEESAKSLLSGYNTMSDEKKKNVDFKTIVKIFHKVFYGIAITITVIGILSYFFKNDNLWAALLSIIGTWGFLPLFFTGKKHDTNIYSKWQIVLNYFVMLFLIVLGLIVAISVYHHKGSLVIE